MLTAPDLDLSGVLSLEQQVALLSTEEQDAILSGLNLEDLAYDWRWGARPQQYLDPHDESWAVTLALAGRGSGKQLAVDTPIPTPTGWTTMGDLHVGDWVLDEAGVPCRVTGTYSSIPNRVYRITFTDGTSIVADAEHQWVTWTHRDRKQFQRHGGGRLGFPADWATTTIPLFDAHLNQVGTCGPTVRTTQDIVDTFYHGARRDRNHCIPLAAPLQLDERDLPVDPWLLGFWLGDGDSAGATLTIGETDAAEIHTRVTAAGYVLGRNMERREGYAARRYVRGVSRALRQLGVLRNKHIPPAYLRASEAQRLALLRGLMDADGYTGGCSVEFCSTREALARGVLELARTLGEKPALATGDARLNGTVVGTKYRVSWRPRLHNPFSLPRKTLRVLELGAQALRSYHRMIVSCSEAPIQPMKCITVDSPNSLYLAGEGMIPTHNTRLATEWLRGMDEQWASMPERHGLTGDGGLRIGLLGRTAADVRDVLVTGQSGLLHIYPPSLQDRIEYVASQRRVTLPFGAQVLLLSAEEPDQVRGPEFHVAVADELAAHRGKPGADGLIAWDNLRIACRLGRTPQIVGATTPKRAPVMRRVLNEAKDPANRIMVRRMKTTDNPYLSDNYLSVLLGLYAGTSIGTQELDGEMLEDVAGALVKQSVIDNRRVTELPSNFFDPDWTRIVGVDPSVSDNPRDECGIIVAGAKMVNPVHKRVAVIADDRSLVATPATWARVVVQTAHDYRASVVVESNQGGAMAAMVIRSAAKEMGLTPPAIRQVWASGAKKVRAEPMGTAYERGRVYHHNVLPEYESQLCFPAGTLITTDRGLVPIENVSTADRVLTREGFAPLKKSWQTGMASTLTTITHSTGVIVSTPWHQIWTENRGFVSAMSVRPSDLLAVAPSLTPQSVGAATGGEGLRRGTTALAVSFFTVLSGKRTLVSCQRACMSTTVRVDGTTALSPSKFLPQKNTELHTTLNAGTTHGVQRNVGSRLVSSGGTGGARTSRVLSVETRSAAETCVPSTAQGSVVTVRTTGKPSPTSRHEIVSPVALPSLPTALTESTVHSGVKTASRPDAGVPVYDLSVADGYPHEFYADGVLVHNCEWVEGESGYSPDRLDAGVWAVSPLLFPETLKGGLPGTARTSSPNALRQGSITGRQVNVSRARPARYR